MILYYFPIAQNKVNKTVNDFFTGIVYAYKYIYVHMFTIALFTGLILV